MELKGSLPCSHQPTTGPDPEPDKSSPHPHVLFHKIHPNIILPFIPSATEHCGLVVNTPPPGGPRFKSEPGNQLS
jgi:hypothetical protein